MYESRFVAGLFLWVHSISLAYYDLTKQRVYKIAGSNELDSCKF